MDRFDGILADAGQTVENMSWMLVCDRPEKEQLKIHKHIFMKLVCAVAGPASLPYAKKVKLDIEQ